MKGNLLKDAEVNKKSLTKAEIYGIIRTYIQELHSLSDRKQKIEENFSLPAWAGHQAYQLGYQRSLEKILEFIPDLDQRITRVKAGSPAEQAGLRPGFIILSIDDSPIEQIIAKMEGKLAPPYHERGRIENMTRAIQGLIYGDPGTCVSLAYLDEIG